MGKRLNWERARLQQRVERQEWYGPTASERRRDWREDAANRILETADKIGRTKKRWKRKARQAVADAMPVGRPIIIDNAYMAFVTLKYADGNIRTIGRACPWFADAMARARE